MVLVAPGGAGTEGSRSQVRRSLSRPGPGRVLLLAAGLASAAAVAHGAVLTRLPATGELSWATWAAFAILFAAAELVVVHLHRGRQTISYSLSELPLIVGLAFLGPLSLVSARVIGAGAAVIVGRRGRPTKMAFGLAHMWFETVLATVVWHLVLGSAPATSPRGWLAALAVVAATDVYSAVSVQSAIRLAEGPQPRGGLWLLASGSVGALANMSLGVLVITVVTAEWRAAWALLLLGAVLVAAYRSYSALRRRHDSLEKLATFTNDMSGELSIELVAGEIVGRVASLLDAEVVELTWSGGEAPVRLVGGVGRPTQVVDPEEPSCTRALGIDADEAVVLPRGSRDPALRTALQAAGLRDAISAPLQADDVVCGRLVVADRQGDVVTFSVEDLRMVQALSNQAAGALKNSQLADRLRDEAQIRRHQALHDGLTDLPNRASFQTQVGEHLAAGGPLAVLLLDLDHFKEVNDTLGHGTGDDLLRHVAARMRAALPDPAVVARLGGDEFAVLLPGLDELEAAAAADRVCELLTEPCAVRDFVLHVNASIGVAVSPTDGLSADVLLQRADVAMYSAKASHTGFAMYSADLDHYSPRRLTLFGDLRAAVEERKLEVHYQPKVDLATGVPVGVEALVRWQHPRYGMVPPDEFIPIAENTDLMVPLTTLVLETALLQTARWRATGLPLSVAVNLSPRMLLQPSLAQLIADLLGRAGLPPEALILEITESSIMGDPGRSVEVLDELDAMGVRLSIDDFGTGYSSLAYLRRLPVHEVKVDKSFVLNLPNEADGIIVEATVELAHRLGMEVVAEGVETAEAYGALRALGCERAQGYLLSRPLPEATLTPWLRQRLGSHPEPLALVAE